MKSFILIFLIAVIFTFQIFPQENEINNEDNKNLEVVIISRIIKESKEILWEETHSKFTSTGKSINLRLKGEKFIVSANLTPLLHTDEKIVLIAQGQIWIPKKDKKGFKYYTTVKTLKVMPGEKILFYPLGKTENKEKKNSLTIELEIEIIPIKGTEKINNDQQE